MEQYTLYAGAAPPISLVREACQKRNDGEPCSLYRLEERVIDGKKAKVHVCSGNSTCCDHITSIGLVLSDELSELHQKVFGKK